MYFSEGKQSKQTLSQWSGPHRKAFLTYKENQSFHPVWNKIIPDDQSRKHLCKLIYSTWNWYHFNAEIQSVSPQTPQPVLFCIVTPITNFKFSKDILLDYALFDIDIKMQGLQNKVDKSSNFYW